MRSAASGAAVLVLHRNQAERVTGRIGEYPERLAAAKAPGAEREYLLLRLIEVADSDVEVHLLGKPGVWPRRGLEIRRELKGQPGPVRRVADHYPVLVVLHSLHAQDLLVEGGQPGRVWSIDH